MKCNLRLNVLVYIIVAAIIFVFSYHTVWMGDDIIFQYNFSVSYDDWLNDFNEFEDGIKSFNDVVQSQVVHYNTTNGRTVAHVFVQYFCGIGGHIWFALCNALMYVALIALTSSVVSSGVSKTKTVISVSLFALLCFSTYMAPACQINYIWMFVFALSFIKLFEIYGNTDNYWHLLWLVPVSFVCGAAHESICVGIGGAIVIHYFKNIRQYTVVQYAMSIAFGAGMLCLCLAPGNFVRFNSADSSSLFLKIITFLFNTEALIAFMFSLLVPVVALWISVKRYGRSVKETYKESSFIWDAWAFCLLFNFFIGLGSSRALFGAELMAIIILLRALKNRALSNWWNLGLVAIAIIMLSMQAKSVFSIERDYNEIVEKYKKSPDGEVFVKVSSYSVPYFSNYSHGIPYIKFQGDIYEQVLFQKNLNAKYGDNKGYVKMIPDYLEGKDTVNIGNQLVDCGSGYYLLVQSKEKPAQFFVNREINKLGIFKRSYEPLEVAIDEPIKETELWRAKLIHVSDYTILGLSDNTVVMQ